MEDKRLLLHIEDDKEIVLLVATALRHPQLATISAPDGPTGLTLASRHRPDLILLDVMLPEMNGYEVFERLSASPETADIPVIMLTVRNRPHEITRARSIKGLGGYIGKPFDVLELRRAVGGKLGIAY